MRLSKATNACAHSGRPLFFRREWCHAPYPGLLKPKDSSEEKRPTANPTGGKEKALLLFSKDNGKGIAAAAVWSCLIAIAGVFALFSRSWSGSSGGGGARYKLPLQLRKGFFRTDLPAQTKLGQQSSSGEGSSSSTKKEMALWLHRLV